jgi:hypothetical protein
MNGGLGDYARWLADVTVIVHFAFVLFVVFGGLMVLWRRWIVWLHLPAVAWGAWIEFAGWICPLTPLENWLRLQGGGDTYASTFTERYLSGLLYPPLLTRELQWVLGTFVVIFNALVYALVLRRRRVRAPSDV